MFCLFVADDEIGTNARAVTEPKEIEEIRKSFCYGLGFEGSPEEINTVLAVLSAKGNK